MSLDVIALVNVDTAALNGYGEEMLKDFVEHGGTLLYAGDYWAYRRGHLANGPLAELLPVTCAAKPGGHAMLLHHGDGTVYRCADNGACTVPLAPGAVLCYNNDPVTVKPGARVLLACHDGTPVLVGWKCGQGRVLALTGTALGEAPAGSTLFTQSPAWSAYVAGLLKAAM